MNWGAWEVGGGGHIQTIAAGIVKKQNGTHLVSCEMVQSVGEILRKKEGKEQLQVPE